MSQSNDKSHQSNTQTARDSRLWALFIGVLLLIMMISSQSQAQSKNKGWAINSSDSLETEAGETKTKETAKANSAVDENLEPSKAADEKAVGSEVTLGEAALAEEGLASIESVAQQLTDESEPSNKSSKRDVSLFEYDISVGAKPLDIPSANVRPVAVLSPELRDNLARQFQEIETLKETEDAYSEQLGESYLSYGRVLMQAGRIDESRKMLVNALHIVKINNGVNSIEQRPVLRELFEMNFALRNTEETEEHLRKIIWLEKKDPNLDDVYSFDMVVRLGNQYLDLYLNNPTVSELSLEYLNKSTRYLGYAVNRYGNRPLSEVLLPYGELALAHQLRSRIQLEVSQSFYQDSRQRGFASADRASSRHSSGNSFFRSEAYLRDYLRKAQRERDLVNTIHALLGLGDLALTTGRLNEADKYYDLAWTGAQNLPATHPIVESFNHPVKLPSFQFSVVRKPVISARPVELVPLSINIENDGRVRKVARDALVETTVALTGRARRLVKRVRFRPIIENGKLVPVEDYRYEVPVAVRKSKAVVSKDPAE